jgi:hypothetical protein
MRDFLKRLRFLNRDEPPSDGDPFSLDRSLLTLPGGDHWRIRDACEGTQVFGMTGSGKTSGSGKALAAAFLNAGFGGLVLTAKTDERELWEGWAREAGRTDDLCVVTADGPHTFNFMDYEVRRPGAGAGLTHNLVHLFQTIFEVGARQGEGGGEDSGFWRQATEQLLRNAIDLVVLATGRLSLELMCRVVLDAPRSPAMVQSKAWHAKSACMKAIVKAKGRDLPAARASDLEMVCRYWLNEFPGLAEKTRSIIMNMFTGMAESFLRHPFKRLFCQKTTIRPEQSFEGAIIVLDLPVKEYDALGKYAQVLFKFIWQRAVERRDIEQYPRPVFLWADEAQFFVSSSDAKFQSTARSKRACTVYLSQNLPSYVDELGGERHKPAVLSLLGNLGTKIFHANSDTETNHYAAEIVGKSLQRRLSSQMSTQDSGMGNQGSGFAEIMDYELQPQAFTTLRKGGPDNDLRVDGIVYQGGRTWSATGKTYLPVAFEQA